MTRCPAFGAGSERALAGHAELDLLEAVGVAALTHNLDGIVGQRCIDAAELFDQIAWCDEQWFGWRLEHFRYLDVPKCNA